MPKSLRSKDKHLQQLKFARVQQKRNKKQKKTRFVSRSSSETVPVRIPGTPITFAMPRKMRVSSPVKWVGVILTIVVLLELSTNVAAKIIKNDNVPIKPNKRIAANDKNHPTHRYHSHNRHQNKNLKYPLTDCRYQDFAYSNSSYQGKLFEKAPCQVVQLTRDNIGKTKILDFWGEGRVVQDNLVTGFIRAYNVNYQNQKVSNGANMGGTIPNRVPTRSYDDVNIAQLVADDTFPYVTLMGAPVTTATANEMYRVVSKAEGSRIVIYGDSQSYLDTLQVAAQNDFIYMHFSKQYVETLSAELAEITIKPVNPFVPIKEVMKDLRENLAKDNITHAVRILKDLDTYCAAGYSHAADIRKQTSELLQGYSNIQKLKAGIEKQAQTHKASSINKQFFTPLENQASLRL